MPNVDINEITNRQCRTKGELYSPSSGWFTIYDYTSTSIGRRFRLYRDGGTTPHFHSKTLRPNPLPVNAFTYEKTSRYGMVGTLTQSSAGFRETSTGNVFACEDPPEHPSNAETNLLIFNNRISFLQKLADTKVNLGQIYAERNQTARLIGDTAIAVADIIRKAKRGQMPRGGWSGSLNVRKKELAQYNNLKNAKGKINKVAQMGLAVQYGIRPLLSDCYGAAEALAKSDLDLPPPQVITKRSSLPFNIVRDASKPALGYTHTIISKGKFDFTTKCSVLVDGAASAAFSVSSLNPAGLAWELLPLSFVADWFFDIGGWVNSWTAGIGVQVTQGHETTFISGTRTDQMIWDGTASYKGSLEGNSSQVRCTRKFLHGLPSPGIPPYDDKSSIEHMFNGCLLLAAAVT